MFESFFGFRRRPFLAVPATDWYYPAESIEHARGMLARAIERGEGPALVIGGAGTGKSMLCEVLATQFAADYQKVQLATARLCTRRALLQSILHDLQLPFGGREEGVLRLALIDHLTGGSDGRPALFLIDEAHALPLRLLEELRLITNLVRDGQPCVRLVLFGNHLLEEHFAHPRLESLNQRIAARCYLQPMDARDTHEYIRATLCAAGDRQASIFEPAAAAAVYRASDGIPRLVNQICDRALLAAFEAQRQVVGPDDIEEAWANLQQLPMPWDTVPPASPRPSEQEAIVEFGALADDDDPHQLHLNDETGLHGEAEQSDEAESGGRASIPFPHRRHQAVAAGAEQLAEQEQDQQQFRPAGTIGLAGGADTSQGHTESMPEDPLSEDPFSERFSEQEVLIDPYASLDAEIFRNRPRVHSGGADPLAEHLASGRIQTVRPQLVLASGDEEGEQERGEQTPARSAATAAPLRTASAESIEEAQEAQDEIVIEGSTQELIILSEVQGEACKPSLRPRETAARLQSESHPRDILIIEEEPLRPKRVRRHEYSQLFARLQRTS